MVRCINRIFRPILYGLKWKNTLGELSSTQSELSSTQSELSSIRDYYLSLMAKCLVGTIYEDSPLEVNGLKGFDAQNREYGWDWPSMAHSMIGSKRMENVRLLTESVLGNQIEGDVIETGVWRGGACIMMRAVLKAYNVRDRKVWLADSFEGLPAPNTDKYPDDEGEVFHEYDELAVTQEMVEENFRKYDLLDEQVKFLKGWFKDTLPSAPIEKLALIRLDGDLYESTIQPLEVLYDKLSIGGYVIVDDYHVVKGCKKAIHDFFNERDIKAKLQEIDGVGVYWQK
ncbi:TylF/MycF family methyltransferase [bacterium AH-315-G11]|nr:TylF/MycF family methyltransferase [bacterium AH-315-G11]